MQNIPDDFDQKEMTTMEQANLWATFVEQAPYIAALVIIVVVFLRYLDRWHESWQQFIKDQDEAITAALAKLTEAQNNIPKEVAELITPVDKGVKETKELLVVHHEQTKAALDSLKRRERKTVSKGV